MQKHKILTDHIKELTDIKYGEWNSGEADSEDTIVMPTVIYNSAVNRFLFDFELFIVKSSDIKYHNYEDVLKRAKIKNNTEDFYNADITNLSSDVILAMIVGILRKDRFCEGILLETFENGYILRWLKRIKEIDLKEEITDKIDKTIKSIWKKEISADYKNGWLLKEDTLKNAFYFHLRKRLDKFFAENNIRIFTEFSDGIFYDTKCRPDMVIAKVNLEADKDCFCDCITDYFAVIEFKFKNGYIASNDIYKDYAKLRKYANRFKINSKFYMATIWEYEDTETCWESENNKWAKGKLTELNASYTPGTYDMRFYIKEHK